MSSVNRNYIPILLFHNVRIEFFHTGIPDLNYQTIAMNKSTVDVYKRSGSIIHGQQRVTRVTWRIV